MAVSSPCLIKGKITFHQARVTALINDNRKIRTSPPVHSFFACTVFNKSPTFLLIAFTCCYRSVPSCCYIHLFYNPSLLELKIYLAVGETIDIQLTNHWVVPPEIREEYSRKVCNTFPMLNSTSFI